MALRIVDRAMQVHGAEGISQDTPLAYFYASLRTLKYADVSGFPSALSAHRRDIVTVCGCADKKGPDEVHLQQIGKQELKRVSMLTERRGRIKKSREGLAKL